MCDRNHAHRSPGRPVVGRDEITPPALPTVFGGASQARIARARPISANGFGRIYGPVAVADDRLALDFETGLPKPGGARLLCSVGERTRTGEVDESDFVGAIGDFGSMPFAQARVDGRIT